MNEQDRNVREPDAPERTYQAQPAATAPPATATREREGEDDADRQRDTHAMDERAAAKPIEPSGRTDDLREAKPASLPDGNGSRAAQAQSLEHFSGRWEEIQSGFVDDPLGTVERADRLVAEVIERMTTMFNDERKRLEARWSRSEKVETEDLRLVIQGYREFFRTLVGR
ncbi:MAG TPA: hypothetical protein VM674_08055 [Candidatus Acidoferrum sp.]|nr:hypothetical protein [Candidatus Acidoferrum sp.]